DHGYYRSVVEIRDTSKHLIVKYGCNNFVLSSHGFRNTVIGKAEEKALYKGCCKGSKQRTDDRLLECFQRGVSHDSGDNRKFLVDIFHRIGQKHKGYRKGVDHISDHKSVKSVDIKQLPSKEPCQKSLFSEGIDNGKSVCNSRQKHWKLCCQTDKFLIFSRCICIMYGVRK